MNTRLALPDADLIRGKSDLTFAVAFGGGGARGISHICVIEALDELGIRPVAIAGSSIGAIMGAGMAAGMSGREIHDYTVETIGPRGTLTNKLWSLGPASMRDTLGGFKLGQFNLELVLKALLPPAIPDDFDTLKIPLKVMATDYYGQAEVVLESGDLANAIAASAALPGIFMPVRINGRIMIDGGVFNPVPYDHLMDLADVVIGVDVVGAPEGDDSQAPTRIDSMFGASQLMMQSAIAMKLRLQPPHIFLRPPVNRYRVLDFRKAEEILEHSASVKDDLKRAVDAIYLAAEG
ncbi:MULTISPECIES: patatin-like phospholipase family protein [Pseudorhizobium]|jgi:NTE family protein|uniref:Patatin n=1 Tax=Pseudorhizobium pelagicum TaxID=1509405 RepID=A0A922P3N0_9HYPH|nr:MULTISPECIES: patatin-like phospholipase family protein [Pseudorhizobium]MBU1314161.1 patatin-like phospholipase family protein [Alphaproteobacteria bacterium]KEQ09280.1 Patatin [Pseudorhizobium pelagicum]KEQ10899.1 Patatin [Pseudorhizobium pelagicum]MBU1552513.1 patatin-like phospholipase family protein [Alphaproteobacteria bacterium]MBU2339456.1 patatin-like phospholipase family protein [Alphaproteobacteria bacterium]|tara:strand:+ start:5287 stop:6165 length:879 start_codon:yes stop_codon:yes gene_type:complete